MLGVCLVSATVAHGCIIEIDPAARAAVNEAKSLETWHALQSTGGGLSARMRALDTGKLALVGRLLDGGDDAAKLMRDELAQGGGYDRDEALVLYAYSLGRMRDRKALGPLADFLSGSFAADALVAPDAATDAIFTILGDARRRTDTFHYGLDEQDAAIAAARAASASAALDSGAPRKCTLKYVLADAQGKPLVGPNGEGYSFDCQQINGDDVTLASRGLGDRADAWKSYVEARGGSYVKDYDGGVPSERYNCAGFAFREFTKGSSFNCDAPTMLRVLTAAGVLRKKSGAPAVGDKVFFFNTDKGWLWDSVSDHPDHVAVVQDVVNGKARVRAPDNQSGVFDADIDAKYFNGGFADTGAPVPEHTWTPGVYEWTSGKAPSVISAGTGDPRYCKQDECGGCPSAQVCLNGKCVEKNAKTSCALRQPHCCPGHDDSCTAPDAQCYCDNYCLTAHDCCPDACGQCGYCG